MGFTSNLNLAFSILEYFKM